MSDNIRNIKIYNCNFCEEKFYLKINIKKHVLQTHEDEIFTLITYDVVEDNE